MPLLTKHSVLKLEAVAGERRLFLCDCGGLWGGTQGLVLQLLLQTFNLFIPQAPRLTQINTSLKVTLHTNHL